MKEQFKTIRLIGVILLSSLLLQACGGSSDKTPVFTISTDVTSVAFTNEFLQEETNSIAVNVNFDGDGLLVGFAPNTTPVGWLNYRVESVTATSAIVHIDVVNANQIAANLYGTTLRLSSGDSTSTNLAHQDINVSLLVWQTLTFDDTYGTTDIASKTLNISSTADNLTITSSVPWLTVESSFADGTTTINMTPDVSSLTSSGLFTGAVQITSPLGTTEFPVELSLDNIYLFTEKANLSFVETANILNKEKTLRVNSNSILPWGWTASTDQPWLTLTPNYDTNELKVTVDSSSIANNTTSLAQITIASDANTVAISDIIKVSFYKSDIATKNDSIAVATGNNAIATDPLLPIYYVAVDNELRRYHLYTNELLSTTIISPEGSSLEQLIPHPEKNLLLAKADEVVVIDENTSETITHRYKINTEDLSFIKLESTDIVNEPVKFLQIDGRTFAVTSALEFATEDLIRVGFDSANAFFARNFNVASQTQALFALDATNGEIKRLTAKVNDFGSNPITTEISHSYRPTLLGDNEQMVDLFVSANEENIYTISPSSEWISFDGTTFTDNGLLKTNEDIVNLALTHSDNDRPHYARFDPESGFKIDVYDESRAIAASIALGSVQPSSLMLSNDNNRAIINSTRGEAIDIISLSQFSTSVDELSFTTNFGDSTIAQQTLTLTHVGDDWTASANVPWLTLTRLSDESGDRLLVDIDRSLISGWGLMSASISIYDPASGTTRIIQVELAVDAIRLSSNYPAIAFNALATEQTLTHTIDILSNSESPITWSATSDASWLTLSQDNTNHTLTITALPASAVGNGLHKATIALAPTNSDAALSSTIEVTLNKGTTDSTDVNITGLSVNTSGLVLDPTRPYFYVATGDELRTYHVISGALVNSTSSLLAGVDLTNLVIHPDGSLLLASNSETYTDEDGVEQTRINHYQFDLNNYQLSQISSEDITIEFRPMVIKMVSGVPIVITQALEFANLNLERLFWDQENAYLTSRITSAMSTDVIKAYKQDSTSIEGYELNYNAYASDMIAVTEQPAYVNTVFTSLTNFVLSKDGENIYTANSESEWTSFDGTNYNDNGQLHTASNIQTFQVTVDSADNSYFYRLDPLRGLNITKYNSNQVELWSDVISANSANSYLMPNFQRIITYDASSTTINIRSHQ